MKEVFRLRATAGEFIELINFTEKFAFHCGLVDAERACLSIIIEELFTNSIRHGHSNGASARQIEVVLAAAAGQIEIDFVDDGVPFDPLAQTAPEFDRPPAERPVGGLGLHIVRSLVDDAHYRREDGRNHLTLVRKINRPG